MKAVFFDLDGVLIDTEPRYSRFWREAAEECGFAMTYEESLALRSLDAGLARERFLKQYGSDVYVLLRETRKRRMEEYRKDHPVMEKKGARAILEHLKESGIPYYIVTASSLSRAERHMRDAHLPWDASRLISTKSVGRGKPYPDVYLEAVRTAKLKPEEVLAVEDSPNGIKSAHAAGCLAVMIPDLTEATEEDKSLCYRICSDLDELWEMIKEEQKAGGTHL